MKNNVIQKITILIFILFIGIFSLWNVIIPTKEYSENENRTLSSLPETNIHTVFTGNYDDLFETYFSDQFVQRDSWIELKAAFKKLCTCIENNNVYFGKDDKLIRSFMSYDMRSIKQNVSMINEFAENNHIKANILIVPTACSIDSKDLPSGSYNVNQKELSEFLKNELVNQNYIDIYASLENHDDLYYRTDHHWNESGAYIAYEEICKQVLQKEPETFSYIEKSDSFFGTMYSRSGAFWVEPDKIVEIKPDKEIEIETTYDGTETISSVFSEKRLNEKDKYMYYLDGNHAHVSIQTSVSNNRKAIIIQDSYAHILIPYLISEYEQIEVFDPRYYHDSVSEFIDENTDVYFIYSMDNFVEDKNLVFLK